MSTARATWLERQLGSARGRVLFSLGLAALVSLVTTAPHLETADLGGVEVDLSEIYLEQLGLWAAWTLGLWPLTLGARWLLRSTHSWLVLLAVLTPTSLVAALGMLHFEYELRRPSEEEVQAWVEEGREWRAERMANHRPPSDARPRGGPGPRRRDGLGPPDLEGEGPLFGIRPDDRPRGEEAKRRDAMGALWRARRARMERPNIDTPFWRRRWIQNTLLFWAVVGLGGGLMTFLELRRKERHAADLELRASQLREELSGAKLETLRGQLQPHFLFNSLHSIGGLIRCGEREAALKTLSALGQLLRSTLELGEKAEVSLEDELRIARLYTDVEHIRFGERLAVHFEVDSGLEGASIPTLLLLPLVENSVKYAIGPSMDGGTVWIEARRRGEMMALCVRDDGPGFPQTVLEGGSSRAARRSIGMENTRRRLRALYGDLQRFELSNPVDGGARVDIELPLRMRGQRSRGDQTDE